MNDLPDLETLKAHYEATMKSCRLVGNFMYQFALMESRLDDAMAAALGLGLLQSCILGPNIPFAAKVNIAQAAMKVSRLDDKKQKHYNRHLRKVRELSIERNMVAHTQFFPTDDLKSTKFGVVRATDDLTFQEDVWTDEKFKQRADQLRKLYGKLTDLKLDLEAAASKSAPKNYLALLFEELHTKQGTSEPTS